MLKGLSNILRPKNLINPIPFAETQPKYEDFQMTAYQSQLRFCVYWFVNQKYN